MSSGTPDRDEVATRIASALGLANALRLELLSLGRSIGIVRPGAADELELRVAQFVAARRTVSVVELQRRVLDQPSADRGSATRLGQVMANLGWQRRRMSAPAAPGQPRTWLWVNPAPLDDGGDSGAPSDQPPAGVLDRVLDGGPNAVQGVEN